MKILVIGDIHNKIARAEYICSKFPDHLKVFVGDYFDDFGDTPMEAEQTALWLKESLKKDDRIHLMGNHDFPYYVNSQYPHRIYCSGFSTSKQLLIEKVLNREDWNKVKYYYHGHGWFISHAGFTLHWWADPLTGLVDPGSIDKILSKSLLELERGMEPLALWAADFFRGGRNHKGGLLWNDWHNLDYIPNFNQIVGHTPNNHISVREDEEINAKKVLVDCWLKEVLEINEDGSITKILDLDFG